MLRSGSRAGADACLRRHVSFFRLEVGPLPLLARIDGDGRVQLGDVGGHRVKEVLHEAVGLVLIALPDGRLLAHVQVTEEALHRSTALPLLCLLLTGR